MTLPLNGVRVLDFTWMNAGAKGTRHLSLYGAECVHLEWKGKLDNMRYAPPYHKLPGEGELIRGENTPGYARLDVPSVNRSSMFNSNHVGKWGLSLNMRHPKGKDIFRRLVKVSDVICDNFTATTLEDWGFGWDALEEINPRIIYVQMSGFGRQGRYADFRSYGPVAAAMSGLTWQVGLADRYPSGYGYSYMDVCAPYYMAMAVLAALRQRNRTGKGVYVDLSQTGPAFLFTGTSIPEWSANGQTFQRVGNRSPYRVAAPHGAYPCRGKETWIAIACMTEEHWIGLVEAMGSPQWAKEERFTTLDARYCHQDGLDARIGEWTQGFERYGIMGRLQAAGVPAAVCQDARDRFEKDPQLKHREYFVQVPHSEAPPYETEGHPSRFSETQPHPLGRSGWGAPCYGEHNAQVYSRLLGLSEADLAALKREDVI